jgi:hypothetical protein
MKCQREQSLREMREEKGRELMRKGGKKKQFFFNRLRGHRAGKKKIGEHVAPTKKPQCREKEKKN